MIASVQEIISVQRTMPQPVPWLWPGRIAAGRLTLIDGDPDQGKSLLTLDLAARLTTGRELPDGSPPSKPSAVLLLSAEDNREDTIVPRLLAAGADLERVHFWDEATDGLPEFPEACPRLLTALEQTQARLVVLDPFFAFLGQEIASLNDRMIRPALQPLARVAEMTHAGVLLNRHLSKDGVTKQAIHRGLGSIVGQHSRTDKSIQRRTRMSIPMIRIRPFRSIFKICFMTARRIEAQGPAGFLDTGRFAT
jgi:RecA-family ATPase